MLSKRATEKFLEQYFDECVQYWTSALADKSYVMRRVFFDIDVADKDNNGELLDAETKKEFILNKKAKLSQTK